MHLIQILNMLEAYDLKAMGQNSAASLHLMIEAMKRAYADRVPVHMGDPDSVAVPVKGLTCQSLCSPLREGISCREEHAFKRCQAR